MQHVVLVYNVYHIGRDGAYDSNLEVRWKATENRLLGGCFLGFICCFRWHLGGDQRAIREHGSNEMKPHFTGVFLRCLLQFPQPNCCSQNNITLLIFTSSYCTQILKCFFHLWNSNIFDWDFKLFFKIKITHIEIDRLIIIH